MRAIDRKSGVKPPHSKDGHLKVAATQENGREWYRARVKSELRTALERVAQGELDQARSAHGASDFAERTVRDADGFHIVDGRVAEVGVVPNVKEVGGETDSVALGEMEILDEREVPILLRRAAINIAAEVAKSGGAEIGVGKDSRIRLIGIALRRIEQRRSGECGRIQVTINALVDVAAGEAAGDGAAGSQLAAKSSRREAESQECAAGARIGDGEWRAGLKDGDTADSPIAKECLGDTRSRFEDRQVVAVADHEAVGAVEIRKAARTVQGGFIVESGVERGVAGGRGIGGSGPSVSGLEVATGPAAGECGLKRIVVRVGIVGEKLEAGVAVDALHQRTGDGVAESVGGDGSGSGARGIGEDDRVVSGVAGLQAVAGFAEMDGVGADVANFENPLFAESALNGQVPLLGVRHHKVARNL